MKEDLLMFWGWTRNDHSYKGLVDTAPKNWQIHTINFEDLVTHGWIDKLSENVRQHLEEKNLNKVHVMGHSMGGALALQFTHQNPKLVNSLYLLDSAGVYGHETLPQLFTNFFKSHSLHGSKKAKENSKAMYRAFRRPLAHLRLAKYAQFVDLQEEAKQIRVPTTLIWGEKDHLIPVWQGERFHELIPGSKLIVLPGMDHDWPLHAPRLFWENIR